MNKRVDRQSSLIIPPILLFLLNLNKYNVLINFSFPTKEEKAFRRNHIPTTRPIRSGELHEEYRDRCIYLH